MHMTDGEFGMAVGFMHALKKREAAHDSEMGQLIDHVHALTAELQKARAELREERGRRRLLQMEMDNILDMVID